jgi:hypothetical protein
MTQLRHKGCGGQLLLDVSGAVALLTPSYNLSVGSAGIGTVELSRRGNSVPIGNLFLCSKCSQSPKQIEIEGQCIVCRKYLPVSKLNITAAIPLLCTDCLGQLGEIPPEKISTKVAEYRSMMIISDETPRKSLQKALSEFLSI